MNPDSSPGVGIGDLLSFQYPRTNVVGSQPVWHTRLVLVKQIRDLLKQPLKPITIQYAPYVHRGRWLIRGLDLEKRDNRSFYIDAMRHRRREYWLQLALFDPCEEDPEPLEPDGPYAPTRRDRRYLAEVIRHFNRMTAGKRHIHLNLGVFPYEPRRAS